MENKQVLGGKTGVNLADMRPLFLPWRSGPFGQKMPPLDANAAKLSAELAAAAYTMDMTPWIQAGWRDVTVQMENRLREGIDNQEEKKTAGDRLTKLIRQRLVRREANRRDAFSGVAGTLRQVNRESDTCKAVVMVHPARDGHYVVAIGFMGTGNIQDWIANLRMSVEEETHQGFLQLVRHFEASESTIHFPETAKELGLEKLTLQDVLKEAQQADSRFLVWVAGHSQGGALTQLYIHRKMNREGVHAQNLLGYGFASPKPVTGLYTTVPSGVPVYLFENSDDAVPRSGAMVHLGIRLIYQADERLRQTCYQWPEDETSCQNRKLVKPVIDKMTDMPHILLYMQAYLQVLAGMPVEETIEGLALLPLFRGPIHKVAVAADNGFDAVLRFVGRRCASAYQQLMGENMDSHQIRTAVEVLSPLIGEIGVRGFMAAFSQWGMSAHTMTKRDGKAMPSYFYLVNQPFEEMTAWAWTSGAQPQTMQAEPTAALALSLPIVQPITVTHRKEHISLRGGRKPKGGRILVRNHLAARGKEEP